jgi:hypothetical protein
VDPQDRYPGERPVGEESPISAGDPFVTASPSPRDSAAPEILGYSFLRVFVSDGILEEGELRLIESLALRDGVVDSKEKAVLSRIFDRIDPRRLDAPTRESIERLRQRHGIR